MVEEYGLITSDSTARDVQFIALRREEPMSIIGRLVYFDTQVSGEIYRSVGTVTSMRTVNNSITAGIESFSARTPSEMESNSRADLRKSSVTIQAVFRRDINGVWGQHGAALPTSPATGARVCLMSEETMEEMVTHSTYPAIGFFRGMNRVQLPVNTPNFDRSGVHACVLGRSGSGKTQIFAMALGTYMRHENHAIMVIDPQGQWSNENGFIFSTQNFAKGLGRKVTVLKVARDVQLPMEQETLSRMIDKLQPWKRLQKMGPENEANFSYEVAQRIADLSYQELNEDTRAMLIKIFTEIAHSDGTLSRIYAGKDTRERFQHRLMNLIGERVEVEDPDGNIGYLPDPDPVDVERTWNSFLKIFRPLHSLFMSKNLTDGRRHPLGGDSGFLTEFFQVREANPDKPAPYVILDMSPDVTLHAKAGLSDDVNMGMQQLLDNEDIKALMLQMILREMKKASETSFASGTGLLNTQIVFDEAWRYAPEGRATPEIEELANMLEGFALDTRKFGIGWTYILQTPSDLKKGIWRQLTYVYAGYGLVGEDVRALQTLTDDPAQIDLYKQFIAPASTGTYPFMVMGPISPLIFTTAPSFMNAFNGTEEFLEFNQQWIRNITRKRQLPGLTLAAMQQSVLETKQVTKQKDTGAVQTHRVGKNYSTSEPQVALKKRERAEANLDTLLAKVPELVVTDDDLGETPF